MHEGQKVKLNSSIYKDGDYVIGDKKNRHNRSMIHVARADNRDVDFFVYPQEIVRIVA